MADTRDRTDNRPQQMREAEMPRGQAPAVQQGRPLTAVQRAQREREARKGAMLDGVLAHRADIERYLNALNIPFDRFLGALQVGMAQIAKTDDTFFEKVRPEAFLREVIRAAHVGLLPDGKHGAIVRYDTDCSFLPMVEGYVEVLWKTGIVVDINHNVVCQGDDIDFEEGDQGYVKHRRSLTRPADAETIGAWCVINLTTGGRVIEVVDQTDLKKIAGVSKAIKGPRATWEREMHRKAPFRRAVKRMPKTERLSVLIEIDDRNYSLDQTKMIEAPDEPSHKELFGGKPIRRKAKAAPAPTEEIKSHQTAEKWDIDTHLAHCNQGEYEGSCKYGEADCPALQDGPPADADQPFVLRALLTAKNGVQVFPEEQVELWFGDIQQKMKTLSSEHLPIFWEKNHAYVEEAGRNGHGGFAIRLINLATEMGLIKGGNHE